VVAILGSTLETTVALRAAAILLIVGSHADVFKLWGGAHILLGVAGYNFGRFCLTPVSRFVRVRHLRNTIAWVAIPSVLWIAAALILSDDYHPRNLLLANKLLGPHDSVTAGRLWFVEVLVWTLITLAVLFWLPAMDRLERQHSFTLAIAFVVFGMALRFDVLGLGLGRDAWFTVLTFWLFAAGWAAAKATTIQQRSGDCGADRGPTELLRQHPARDAGIGRLRPADLAAGGAVSVGAGGGRRSCCRGFALHLSHPLPGVSIVRR